MEYSAAWYSLLDLKLSFTAIQKMIKNAPATVLY